MSLIRVGVLRGGPSNEYEVSLKSGGEVLTALHSMPGKYHPIDMFVSRDGEWHIQGVPATLSKIKESIDVVFNALHGGPGEDGTISDVLKEMNIPYTGSHGLPSSVAMDKILTKEKLKALGIKVPEHFVIDPVDLLNEKEKNTLHVVDEFALKKSQEIFKKVSPPWIIKPVRGGSSLGMFLAKTLPELVEALRQAIILGDEFFVEQYILGKEATCGVVDKFRGEDVYPLIPIEIRKPKWQPYDYELKYGGHANNVIAGSFLPEEKQRIQSIARDVHKELGLRHYSRSDFVVTLNGDIYFLEVNTLPGLTKHSLVPQALNAIGTPLHHFLDHVISLALEEHRFEK